MTDQHDRQHAPTPRKLQQSLEEGRFARSRQLSSLFFCFGAIGLLLVFGESIWNELMETTTDFLRPTSIDGAEIGEQVTRLGWKTASLLGPILLMFALLAYISHAWQSGFRIFPQRLNADFGRLNWIQNGARVFNFRKIAATLWQLFRMTMILAAGLLAIWKMLPQITSLAFLQHGAAVQQVLEIAAWVIGGGVLIMLVFGLIDYLCQRQQLMNDLRMTEQEYRDEMQETEGNPLIRSQRRNRQQELRNNYSPSNDS